MIEDNVVFCKLKTSDVTFMVTIVDSLGRKSITKMEMNYLTRGYCKRKLESLLLKELNSNPLKLVKIIKVHIH